MTGEIHVGESVSRTWPPPRRAECFNHQPEGENVHATKTVSEVAVLPARFEHRVYAALSLLQRAAEGQERQVFLYVEHRCQGNAHDSGREGKSYPGETSGGSRECKEGCTGKDLQCHRYRRFAFRAH